MASSDGRAPPGKRSSETFLLLSSVDGGLKLLDQSTSDWMSSPDFEALPDIFSLWWFFSLARRSEAGWGQTHLTAIQGQGIFSQGNVRPISAGDLLVSPVSGRAKSRQASIGLKLA